MNWERHLLLALLGGALGYGAASLVVWLTEPEEEETFTFTMNPEVGEIDPEELAMLVMWMATTEPGVPGVG